MPERPNILFLLNDHQAYYRHGWDGGVRPRRPYFDRLAREGICFERAFTASAICVPARRTMATGLFPHNHGMLDNNEKREQRDRDFWWQHLAEIGYRNLYFGKWHHGLDTAQDNGCEGFSLASYGNPYMSAQYRHYCRVRDLPHAWFDVETSFWPPDRIPQRGGYCMSGTWTNDHASGIMRTPTETCESFFLASLAVDALRELAGGRQPWAMQVHFWGPHQPYYPSEECAQEYDPAEIAEYGSFGDDLGGRPAHYRRSWNWPLQRDGEAIVPSPLPWEVWARVLARCYAQITMVDAAAGMILGALDELGLAEDTLVLWTADHGDAVASHGGRFDKRSYMTEEMYRIPMALRWPGRVAAGRTTDGLASNIDLAPTFLDATGVAYERAPDGRSLLPLARGDAGTWREDLMCEIHGHGETVISRLLVHGDWRCIATRGEIDELYDLAADRYQMCNLIDDPAHVDVLADLRQRLRRWQDASADPEDVL